MNYRTTYKLDGHEIKVTNVKFIILSTLVAGMDANETVPTEYLIDELYNRENTDYLDKLNRLKVHVCQLRKQMKPFGYEIDSVHKLGYALRKAEQ